MIIAYLFRAEWTSAMQELCTHNWESNRKAYLRDVFETTIKLILKLTIEEAAGCTEKQCTDTIKIENTTAIYQKNDMSACSMRSSSKLSTNLEWTTTAFIAGARSAFSLSLRLSAALLTDVKAWSLNQSRRRACT